MTMMLGDVLREAQRAADVLDPALRVEIESLRHVPGAFAREAVASFERYASEEDWATLLSSIRRQDAPGKACLEAMVKWQLRRLALPAANNLTPEDESP
jgi:hypothetical protein